MNVAILLISFCRSFVTMDSMISPLPRTSLLQQKKTIRRHKIVVQAAKVLLENDGSNLILPVSGS